MMLPRSWSGKTMHRLLVATMPRGFSPVEYSAVSRSVSRLYTYTLLIVTTTKLVSMRVRSVLGFGCTHAEDFGRDLQFSHKPSFCVIPENDLVGRHEGPLAPSDHEQEIAVVHDFYDSEPSREEGYK